jgi:titin
VQVRGKNAAGFGPWSADAVFHTPPLPPQEAPKELRAEALTDVSGKILWKPLANARIYLLGLGTDTYASNRGEITVSAAGYEMKGLLPETNYFARVKAVNGAGEGPWSEMMGFTTLPSPPFNAPEGMEVMEITSHSLTLHWTPTPDAAAYEVGFGTDPQVAHAQIQSADTCSCKLAGLKPATTYTLRVRKINRGGTGPWSQSRTATTQP